METIKSKRDFERVFSRGRRYNDALLRIRVAKPLYGLISFQKNITVKLSGWIRFLMKNWTKLPEEALTGFGL